VANKTPVATSRTLNSQLAAASPQKASPGTGPDQGFKVFIKCENFQRVGAFKFRGGYNALINFTEEQKQSGVITFSSGNHAQAIALASSLLKIKNIILMPKDTPQVKVDATAGTYGGTVVHYDRFTEDRREVVARYQKESNMTYIPPDNHFHVIAG